MPQGQYPAILAGQPLTASLLQALAPLEAWKTTATTLSTLTLTPDADLQLTVAANATYRVTAGLIYQAASGGFSFAWTFPAGAAGGYEASFNLSGTGNGVYGYAWGSNPLAGTLSGPALGVGLSGTLTTSAGGTFGLKWASGSGPVSLTLGAGSFLEARRIA